MKGLSCRSGSKGSVPPADSRLPNLPQALEQVADVRDNFGKVNALNRVSTKRSDHRGVMIEPSIQRFLEKPASSFWKDTGSRSTSPSNKKIKRELAEFRFLFANRSEISHVPRFAFRRF